jgi:hypothetical protein
MSDYLELLLSIKNIHISEDCINIIIEYIYFDLKYVETININDIKSSKYFKNFNSTLKNNINALIQNNFGLNFFFDNDNLIIINVDLLMIYSNNKLVKSRLINLDYSDALTCLNNKIFFCDYFSNKIKCINIYEKEENIWSIGELYTGCFSIDSYNNKIYVTTYILKEDSIYFDYNYYINIHDEYGKLSKSKNVLNERTKFSSFLSLTVTDGIIYLVCKYNYYHGLNKYNTSKNNMYIYDNDINLIYESKIMAEKINLYSKIKIISANNHIIMRNNKSFFVYEYKKITKN